MAVGVENLKLLDISYDKFIRTTDDYHEKKVVADALENSCSRRHLTWVAPVGILYLMRNFH